MLPCFLLRLSSMLVRTSSAMSLKRFCHADQGGVVTVLIYAHKAICAYAGIAVQGTGGRWFAWSLYNPPCVVEFLDELIPVHLRLAFCRKRIYGRVAHYSILENTPAKAPLTLGISLDFDDEW